MPFENRKIVSPAEWQAARERLRVKEKELIHRRNALAADRRKLPMVRVDKDYAFEGPNGQVSLLDLLDVHRQLLVYHFWFEPGEDPCEGCSLWVSDIGHPVNLHARDTSLRG